MAKKRRPTFSAPPTDRPKPAADWVYRSAAGPAPPADRAAAPVAPKPRRTAVPRRAASPATPATPVAGVAVDRISVNLASRVLLPLAIVNGFIVQPLFSLCRGSR